MHSQDGKKSDDEVGEELGFERVSESRGHFRETTETTDKKKNRVSSTLWREREREGGLLTTPETGNLRLERKPRSFEESRAGQ